MIACAQYFKTFFVVKYTLAEYATTFVNEEYLH
jgi:hypothetical protein